MTKFLELTYYNNRDYTFPNYLKPTIEKSLVGIQTHYIDLSNSQYGEQVFNLFHKKTDLDLINNLIDSHGVFFEKFLARKLRHRIHTYFNDDKNSLKLLDSCKSYYGISENRNNLVNRVKHDFMKVTLIRLNNDTLYKKFKNFVQEKSLTRKCALCSREYKPINLPDWVYYGSNGNDKICYECPTAKSQNKKELKRLINELINVLNFIPNADFNPINNNFSSRVNKSNWIKVCELIFEMGIQGNDTLSSESIFKKKFGSWFKALVYSNVLPNGLMQTGRGFRCMGKSGNECNSLDEMFIDNWLFDNNINSIKEPLYPKHPVYNKSGRRRADWKVGDYFIEYFGLQGEEVYDKKTREKLILADILDLNLIPIYPSDLNKISEKLSFLKKLSSKRNPL